VPASTECVDPDDDDVATELAKGPSFIAILSHTEARRRYNDGEINSIR
jgi:hypothetical protein